ncbi:hypothetical protein GGI42DRAFT_291742 [Trichoderma sp. SZMC 28013]
MFCCAVPDDPCDERGITSCWASESSPIHTSRVSCELRGRCSWHCDCLFGVKSSVTVVIGALAESRYEKIVLSVCATSHTAGREHIRRWRDLPGGIHPRSEVRRVKHAKACCTTCLLSMLISAVPSIISVVLSLKARATRCCAAGSLCLWGYIQLGPLFGLHTYLVKV